VKAFRLAKSEADDIERIHLNSLKVLEEVGVIVEDSQALDIFKKNGAIVDKKKALVRLPNELIMAVIKSAPKEVRLCSLNGETLLLNHGKYFHFSGADMLYVLDFATGRYRESTKQDVINFTRIADYLPQIKGVCPEVYARNKNPNVSELFTIESMVLNTSKHCSLAPTSYDAAKIWIDIGRILSNGKELSSMPIISMYVSPTSPFRYGEETAKMFVHGVRCGVPLISLPAPIAGATAPFTLAGALTVENSENLFALTFSQLIKPGAPFIYGGSCLTMDMRTGEICHSGPGFALSGNLTAQLANFYGVPSYCAISVTDSKTVDLQTGAEKMACYLVAALSGLSLTLGAGCLASMKLASYEQLIIDHELLKWAGRFREGVRIDDDTLAFSTIKRVKPGGNYLTEEHTLKWLRSGEHFYSGLFELAKLGVEKQSLPTRAHGKVMKILREYVPKIPIDVSEEVKEYVLRKEKEILRASS